MSEHAIINEHEESIADLDLPQATRPCFDCCGAGHVRDEPTGCARCNGTGEVARYTADTYDHAMSIAERRAAIERDIRERRMAFESRIQRLQSEMTEALKPLQQRAEFYDNLLTERLARLRAQNPKLKSEPLCDGVKVQSRTGDKWVYGDAEAEKQLLARLKAIAPALVRVKEETDKAALKKATVVKGGVVALAVTGELLDEVTVVTETTYKVTVEA